MCVCVILAEVLRGLTQGARPTFRCIFLCDYSEAAQDHYGGTDRHYTDGSAVISVLAGDHTLD